MTTILSSIVMLLWPLMEISLVIKERLRFRGTCSEGGSAAIVWLVAAPASLLAVACRFLDILLLPYDIGWSLPIAAVVVGIGLIVRVSALLTLGKLFSVDVAFKPDHELVTRGLYRSIRHPAYTGLLIAFLGVGFVSWSWLGLFLTTVPIFLVLRHRIRVEEEAMSHLFGSKYDRYRRSTKRLIPGVY
jgi:protein-S-isoprenylcysteine O-methyltransferase Ste14